LRRHDAPSQESVISADGLSILLLLLLLLWLLPRAAWLECHPCATLGALAISERPEEVLPSALTSQERRWDGTLHHCRPSPHPQVAAAAQRTIPHRLVESMLEPHRGIAVACMPSSPLAAAIPASGRRGGSACRSCAAVRCVDHHARQHGRSLLRPLHHTCGAQEQEPSLQDCGADAAHDSLNTTLHTTRAQLCKPCMHWDMPAPTPRPNASFTPCGRCH
jgi:hypothetical protein